MATREPRRGPDRSSTRGCSGGLIARKRGACQRSLSRSRRRSGFDGNTTSARPSQPASAASSSEIASMASAGACGSRCTAWTSNRPAWRSAFRSSRADEPVAEQEWQDIVAVLALLGRRVDLDPVVEVEEPQRAGALPDERIERRQKRPRGDAARPAGVAVKIGEAGPAGNLDRLENARLDERVDRLSRRRRGRDGNSRAGPAPWRRRAPEPRAR